MTAAWPEDASGRRPRWAAGLGRWFVAVYDEDVRNIQHA
jgi:hypothetical protein